MRAYLHYRDGRVVSTEVDELSPTILRQILRSVPRHVSNVQTTVFQIDILASRETGVGIYREG